ncbi:MAG TPA: efflux RND transporter periplasmic adaptor subunit [Leptospiraceae bacterium]|nr:efflux RND transporter periplasmic adaptor subunit [Leptospiraceae bacterium]HMW04357.1 efflux RND transporter periplasmic adaptor subunit [Leptospiraceae bacterium]HMX31073.1 efflux RND transporter periplasmic adaptor subunit [Leptospiraceae bacterium]HMY31889.1 efflux RND transporter periplasmic adaptor subunit [Leptospiraceae bacterium]HMZ65247.1 efflux RND transporter periplasmic adaptor subunit [Leptospiraceae bacterium]
MNKLFFEFAKNLNKYWYVVIVLLGVGGYLIFQKFKSKPKKAETAQTQTQKEKRIYISKDILKNHSLEYVHLRERSRDEEITLPGKVSYDLENLANVGSRVTGRIVAVYVKEGDHVRQGSKLASISSVELSNAQSTYLKARVKLEALKVQAQRANELMDKKIISSREFEIANMEYKTVKTEMETSYNTLEIFGLTRAEIESLESSNNRQQYLVIRSPINGTVTDRKAVNGQAVNIDENLFVVADLRKLWVLLDVYEKDLNSVKIGAEATIKTLGDKQEVVKAYVAHVSEVIDQIKHTAEIRLEVDNAESKLKPGQTISATVKDLSSAAKARKIQVVPSEAVHKIEGKTIVFAANDDGSFEVLDVTTGDTIDDDIEIKSGIPQNKNIVSTGSFVLKSEYLK